MKCDTEKCDNCGALMLIDHDDYVLPDGRVVCLDCFCSQNTFTESLRKYEAGKIKEG